MQTRARILLVDDEPLVRRSIQKTLRRARFRVETASDCTEALELFEAAHGSDAPFDLAVLDLGMPGFDGVEKPEAGLELLSRLLEHRPDLPVVMLTAYDEVKKAKEAVKRGARAYFVKGREHELVDLIRDILDS